jgi:hypothetical protein
VTRRRFPPPCSNFIFCPDWNFGFQLDQRQTRQNFWPAAAERRTLLASVQCRDGQHSTE